MDKASKILFRMLIGAKSNIYVGEIVKKYEKRSNMSISSLKFVKKTDKILNNKEEIEFDVEIL